MPTTRSTTTATLPLRALSLPALVGLADWLFWSSPAGLSAILFAWSVFAAVGFTQGGMRAGPVILLVIASLPALEHLHVTSSVFLILGLILSVTWLLHPSPASLLMQATRIAAALPTAAIRDLHDAASKQDAEQFRKTAETTARDWAFPLAGALALLALLTQANPVLLTWLEGLIEWDWDLRRTVLRILLWTASAIFVWGLLRPARAPALPQLPRSPELAMTGAIATRALILFNLVLAVQISLDAMVLVGGAALPEGLTYAEYAQRGAYPLMAATLLGTGFAILTRPHLGQNRTLRALLILWIVQNLLMAAGAGVRLALYIEAYGLTFLRLHAGIGMAMIVAMLALIFWQILRDKPGRWLLVRGAAMITATLYMACFVNFADAIARQNIARGGEIDWRYLTEDLPGTARATLAASDCPLPACFGYRRAPAQHEMSNWREWGFRQWRVDSRIQAMTTQGAAQ